MRMTLFIAALLVVPPASAEVYKYVAEDGSMVYTNEKPHPDARPLDLPGLTVMDAPAPPRRTATGTGDSSEGEAGDVYPDLRIVSPQPDETIQGTGNALPVRLAVDEPLRPGDQVMVYLDGEPHGPYFGLAFEFQQVPRGTHSMRVEVVDRERRVVADAGPVTFHMRQHSQLHQNQPLVQPQVNPGGNPP